MLSSSFRRTADRLWTVRHECRRLTLIRVANDCSLYCRCAFCCKWVTLPRSVASSCKTYFRLVILILLILSLIKRMNLVFVVVVVVVLCLPPSRIRQYTSLISVEHTQIAQYCSNIDCREVYSFFLFLSLSLSLARSWVRARSPSCVLSIALSSFDAFHNIDSRTNSKKSTWQNNGNYYSPPFHLTLSLSLHTHTHTHN
jgi:hypothetical protein